MEIKITIENAKIKLKERSFGKIRNGGDGENSRVFGGIHGRGINDDLSIQP